MMYYYWNTKGIRPSVLYNMPKGELLMITAFYEQELKDLEARVKAEEEANRNN
ncbi:hypothetical protein PV797_05330 [Clostridiaceae bacterium M8S5]|nr:hypothetical protein PV797_05330 [Clostridiaceae bacterium M8S5]